MKAISMILLTFSLIFSCCSKAEEDFLEKGKSKQSIGDYRGAISDYTKAIELDPENAEAYHGRGLAKALLLENRGAISDYTKAIELNPENAGKYYYSRGLSKLLLDLNSDGCLDLSKAAELEYGEAYEQIRKFCR